MIWFLEKIWVPKTNHQIIQQLYTERSSTESTNFFFFSDSVNEYKLLGTKSKQKVNFLKMSLSLAPSKKYAMIEEFKHRLKGLKNILNEIKN